MEVYIPVVYNGKQDFILGVYEHFYEAQIGCLRDISEFGNIDDLEIYIYQWEVGEEYYSKVFDYEKDKEDWIEEKI
jgi:hypothetical protein